MANIDKIKNIPIKIIVAGTTIDKINNIILLLLFKRSKNINNIPIL